MKVAVLLREMEPEAPPAKEQPGPNPEAEMLKEAKTPKEEAQRRGDQGLKGRKRKVT